jgi:DNA-binding transcriptional LysR family regulator
MLTWERLHVFAAVVRHGSVHAAAEALHVTGPAVSQQLRRLEREAGCPLVTRDGRGIRLTHAGMVLAGSVQKMADAATEGAADLAAISGLVAGPLRVGAVASVLRSLVPQALLDLTSRYPRLEPHVRDGESTDMLPELIAGRLDVVVMESWTHAPARIPPGVRTRTLARESARLAVHRDHPLAKEAEVPLGSLRDLVWASCPAGSEAHEALVQLLRHQGITDILVNYRVADYRTQLRLVAAGLATALVPQMAAPASYPDVRLIPCTPAVTRTVSAATAPDSETPAVHAFADALAHAARPEETPPGS